MPTSLIKLLNTYSVPGGRYTYYPPHASWKNNLNYFQWWDAVRESYRPDQGVDLYVHIPFCQSICTFCGCNIRVSKSYDDILPYMSALQKEWKLYQNILGEDIAINSLYIGGGSPNFLNVSDLDQLLSHLLGKQTMLAPQISIELDPRYTSREQLQILKKHNVHTLSFGIQDLNSKVLANVNREQNIDEILSLLNYAHSLGFPHINIDLIYGLTHQTPETLSATLEILQQIRADSIALYPFAKVPWQNNSQKAFGDFKDYSRIEMNELFAAADIFLHQMGFTHIGMGHFARNESSFLTLFKKKKLKRNIMGFTEKKSNMLIGLGVSAFSSGITGHVQNEKVLEQYIFALQKDRPPLYKSHAVTSDQLILTAMFEKIICENYFDETDRMKILPEQENNFKLYLQNNFIEHTGDTYSITDQGRYFLKNICQCWG